MVQATIGDGTEFTSMAILAYSQRTAVGWYYIAPGKPMRDTASSKASTAGSATSCFCNRGVFVKRGRVCFRHGVMLLSAVGPL